MNINYKTIHTDFVNETKNEMEKKNVAYLSMRTVKKKQKKKNEYMQRKDSFYSCHRRVKYKKV